MPSNVVNLDALIPRENFDIDTKPVPLNHDTTISINTLKDPNFFAGFRKPDFQRETNHWSPKKVLDLIVAFLNADLIPAIILWQSGPYIFVIDGAHRLSALYAWIIDDYGDKSPSQKYFDYRVPDEQIRIADRTRKLINSEVGTYDSYVAAQGKPIEDLDPIVSARIAKVRSHSFTAQWVLSNDPKVAQDSFFKINQAATPLDPTEARILRARGSANALAARAISHGGAGHQYWSKFVPDIRDGIVARGRALYNKLYKPPMDEGSIKSLDVPIAGRGYSTLPFIFDLVNLANNQKITDSTAKRPIKEHLPVDTDGSNTIVFLDRVTTLLASVSGHEEESLGLHPLVYFYTRTGAFQPVAFFGMAKFIESLKAKTQLIAFTKVRALFEEYLISYREGVSIILHNSGSGSRSLPRMQAYYERLFERLSLGRTIQQVREDFINDREWAFLSNVRDPSSRHGVAKPGNEFNRNTKSAAFIENIVSAPQCALCRGYLHRNSQTTDHKKDRRLGGVPTLDNAQVTHPYCNSIKQHLLNSEHEAKTAERV